MVFLLLPGRQLVTTSFQEDYLKDVLSKNVKDLDLINSKNLIGEKISKIVFAITSSNQDNSRYNPISFHHRVMGVDRFCLQFKQSFNISYEMFGIPHFGKVKDFPQMVFKEIEEQSEGGVKLTPENTIVLTSTPSLIEVYKKKGFAILSCEYDVKSKKFLDLTPQALVSVLFENNREGFVSNLKKLSFANLSLWNDFPQIAEKIARIWADPLLTESGSLTETRDYSTYGDAMSRTEVIKFKYAEIKDLIREGKIVDEGCADGALLSLISRDFPDSDLIGIEITSEFLARCLERQRAGEFGGNYVHFHQRNLLNQIFKDNTIDTTICNSTTHEIYSYGEGYKSLVGYLKKKYNQLRSSGRLIIRDVVGPEDKEKEVYMELCSTDGLNVDLKSGLKGRELSCALEKCSTLQRFFEFAKDYLNVDSSKKMRACDKLKYSVVEVSGKKLIKLSLKDATEFMSKKDYIDNWKSELNEEFSFWSFSDWCFELTEIGFKVLPESYAYVNDWIVKNRFVGKVKLFEMTSYGLKEIAYPNTNMVLLGEK